MGGTTFREGDVELKPYLKWVAGAAVVGILLGGFAGMFAAIGLLLIGNGSLLLPEWYRARTKETKSPGEVRIGDGAVEVSGTARAAEDTCWAPFTGEECLAYAAAIEEYDSKTIRRGSDSRGWEVRWGEDECRPFLVENGTGSVWVDPTDADFHLEMEYEATLDPGENPPDEIRRLESDSPTNAGDGSESISSAAEPETGVVSREDRRRYREYRLDVGDSVDLFGEATPAPDDAPTDVEVAIRNGPETDLFAIVSDPQIDIEGALRKRIAGGVGIGSVLVFIGVLGFL